MATIFHFFIQWRNGELKGAGDNLLKGVGGEEHGGWQWGRAGKGRVGGGRDVSTHPSQSTAAAAPPTGHPANHNAHEAQSTINTTCIGTRIS